MCNFAEQSHRRRDNQSSFTLSTTSTIREFETQFRKLYLPLCMYALRIVDNAEDAEDLVADAFMKVWETIGDGVEIDNFSAFIYRTLRNGCISFLRSQRQMVSLENVPEVNEATVDTSRRDARIWEAIDRLPDKCREIFLMSKRDGMSQEEIAEELNISVKTVKNQMTKAFSRLRESLTGAHRPFFLPFL